MDRRVVVALCALVALSVAGVAVAQDEVNYVRGEPNLDVYAPEATLDPGSTSQLTLQVANDGEVRSGAVARRDIVTTARAVRVDVRDAGPFTVETQRQSIGAVPDGEAREVPITLTVPEGVEPGEHEIEVRLRYSHTFQYARESGVVQERTRTVRRTVDVTVDDGPRFTARTVDSDVQVGDSGTVTTEVTNVGDEAARNVTFTLESTSGDVTLGEGAANTARIDRLDPGESATVAFDAAVRPDVPLREFAFDGSVRYVDEAGARGVDDRISTGLRPADEQSFALSVDESNLRVGETGTVTGTIRNEGPSAVDGVVVRLGDAQFEPRSRSYAVGDLDPGEEATFRFRGSVPATADGVPQPIDVTTAYRTTRGTDRTTTDPLRVPVAERRDAVAVTAENPRFVAGESGTLELSVTNRRDVRIRDVRVELGAEPPLESDFRTTVIPALDPGESDTVAFDLEVDGDAPPSRYPAVVDVEYTDPDDERATARQATVAVDVSEPESTLPVVEVLAGVLALLLVVAGGWWFYGRRLV